MRTSRRSPIVLLACLGMSTAAVAALSGSLTEGDFIANPTTPAGSIDGFGTHASVGDFNGDGNPDLFSTHSRNMEVVAIYGGGSGIDSSTADSADFPSASTITAATIGDFNGDGYDDVAASNNGDATVYLYYGSSSGLDLSSTVELTATDLGTQAKGPAYGFSLTSADFDQDGYDDLVVGDPNYNYVKNAFYGAAYVYGGSASGVDTSTETVLTTSQTSWIGRGEQFGAKVAAGGDGNGDGYPDLVVTHGRQNFVITYDGSASGVDASSELLVWQSETPTNYVANGEPYLQAVNWVGDVNGDGYDELVVSTRLSDQSLHAYIYDGSTSGVDDSTESDLTPDSTWFGPQLTGADFDGDGLSDVVGGITYSSDSSVNDKGLYFFQGSTDGISSADAESLIYTADDDVAGAPHIASGDVDGDGGTDLVLGLTTYDDGTWSGVGAVQIFDGNSVGDGGGDDGGGSAEPTAGYVVTGTASAVEAPPYYGVGGWPTGPELCVDADFTLTITISDSATWGSSVFDTTLAGTNSGGATFSLTFDDETACPYSASGLATYVNASDGSSGGGTYLSLSTADHKEYIGIVDAGTDTDLTNAGGSSFSGSLSFSPTTSDGVRGFNEAYDSADMVLDPDNSWANGLTLRFDSDATASVEVLGASTSTDGDGVCDATDVEDGDDDDVADDCDSCAAEDATGYDLDADGCLDDTDGDGVTDDLDACAGDDATGDTDGDAVCDDTDDDIDGDGIANSDDDFPSDAGESTDTDGDGVGDNSDVCPQDFYDDSDGDAVCDSDDACDGDDLTGDTDVDGVCDDLDACYGDDGLGDADLDGYCDDTDACATDVDKTEEGVCGCGVADDDSDADGITDCLEDDLTLDGDQSHVRWHDTKYRKKHDIYKNMSWATFSGQMALGGGLLAPDFRDADDAGDGLIEVIFGSTDPVTVYSSSISYVVSDYCNSDSSDNREKWKYTDRILNADGQKFQSNERATLRWKNSNKYRSVNDATLPEMADDDNYGRLKSRFIGDDESRIRIRWNKRTTLPMTFTLNGVAMATVVDNEDGTYGVTSAYETATVYKGNGSEKKRVIDVLYPETLGEGDVIAWYSDADASDGLDSFLYEHELLDTTEADGTSESVWYNAGGRFHVKVPVGQAIMDGDIDPDTAEDAITLSIQVGSETTDAVVQGSFEYTGYITSPGHWRFVETDEDEDDSSSGGGTSSGDGGGTIGGTTCSTDGADDETTD